MSLGPEEWQAITLSLQVALTATILSLPLAIWVAHVLARKTFPGKQILNAAVHLPLILPPVVTGYLLLLAFGAQGAIGAMLAKIGVTLAFKWTGAVLAAAIMAFPLMVRAIRLGIEAVDPKLEQAATTLGASPAKVFATITLPMCLPAIIAGAVLAFAKALGEFGATITFVASIPGETRTLPSAIYAFLQVPGAERSAINLTIIAVIIAVAALLISEWLAQKAARR
ncbi:molybdate ABC transporter permease subunit [uncultured Litoreibacter sp.]|uniref:molybdate ABC transporter permease subunit n=1 Tax=uncultured Litoreibacter sp. TaxID=1392394 RepID=UPI00260BF755|nr:molybdate ABC transporter permease subunit [uncultured Litoreibacter sp.]